jgi:NAD(P)-dependent dehydrogenase (short-subunit alcohol dehydrogenase family)
MRFANDVVLVTGAGSGIGQAIATRFASEGAKVAVTDRFGDRAESTAAALREQDGSAIAITMDVTSEAQVSSANDIITREFGPVTILVNNAGLSLGSDVRNITPEEWDINLSVVLKGPYLCTRTVLPAMIERGKGVILNISSVNGMFGIGEEAYSAAKAGLLNFTQNIAMRHGPQGIRSNAISPGTIRSPIWDERIAREPEIFANLTAWYPLGRVGEVDDIAAAALFLCSDEASWITGVNLPVDGGLTAGNHRMISELGGE